MQEMPSPNRLKFLLTRETFEMFHSALLKRNVVSMNRRIVCQIEQFNRVVDVFSLQMSQWALEKEIT